MWPREGGDEYHRSCETAAVEDNDRGRVLVKMDALAGGTYKSLERFENIEIRAALLQIILAASAEEMCHPSFPLSPSACVGISGWERNQNVLR